MYPSKPDKNYKKKKVQSIYRKQKNKEKIANELNVIWGMIVNICLLFLFLYFVVSVLFDIGVPLPPFFGI